MTDKTLRVKPPQFSDKILGAMEAAIIETTGNGEYAAYVINWIISLAATADAPEGPCACKS